MKRYKKIVLEAEKGITFEVSEGTSELIIKALNIATTKGSKKTSEESVIETQDIATTNVYSQNYANPPIPERYKHVYGEWNNGFVIERDSDGSQFVWCPIGSLDSNGTLDGEHFAEKFGRRNYHRKGYEDDEFSENGFHEELTDELVLQLESVKKYGGFYISRYNISWNLERKPRSVKGVLPLVNINFEEAKKVASTIENNEAVKSHLTFGAEYDSILEWFIKTNARTRREIVEDSKEWGNYFDTKNSPIRLVKTGSRGEWYTNSICDFAGNVSEWTQERRGSWKRVNRGGSYYDQGFCEPVAHRGFNHPILDHSTIGFRAALYIK